MVFRRLSSPLHATRAGVAASWCVVLAGVAMTTDHPLLLIAVLLSVLLAAWRAGVGRVVARAAMWTVPIALVFALLNPVVSRNGLTVFARLGEVGPFGQVDLTVEALVYGLVFGLRFVAVFAAAALLSAAVDPDELLALFRRVSPRSALTAVLALRMIPLLQSDARRIGDARRCRADGGGTGPWARTAVLRAVAQSSLDRSLDVAATLEVRGYGVGARPSRRSRPWSRHDLHFLASAVAIAAVAVLAGAAGAVSFSPYDTISITLDAMTFLLCGALVVIALLPFSDRRGVQR